MFNKQYEGIKLALSSICDSIASLKKNHNSLSARVDQLTSKNILLKEELTSSNSRYGLLNEKLINLEKYLKVEFVRENTQGYKKVKKSKETK